MARKDKDNKMKKQYICPKIAAVKLDPEQAILQVCQAGGVWINTTVGQCEFTGGIAPHNCATPRGVLPTASTAASVFGAEFAGS